MKVCCVFSLESPHRGDSNENTIYHYQYTKENHPKLSQICSYGKFSKRLKNEFETGVVNKPSVFEPLKFHCIHFIANQSLTEPFTNSFQRPACIDFCLHQRDCRHVNELPTLWFVQKTAENSILVLLQNYIIA